MSEASRLSARWLSRLLMLVTDERRVHAAATSEREAARLGETVALAIEGGVNAVQLRARGVPAGALLAVARRLRGVCGRSALLFVNDRTDVALMCGADGVQLPEDGLPVGPVRQLLPPSLRVGRSAHSVNAARQAELDGADYLLLGTVFASPSHPDAPTSGIELLENVVRRVTVPVIAIGGIRPENVEQCWRAGAAGVAVISAIFDAPDPRAAAEALRPTVEIPEVPPLPGGAGGEEA